MRIRRRYIMAILTTSVDRVKVYRYGAEITRKGTVTLSAGRQTLEVYGITSNASLDTVRLFGPEGVICSNQHFADPSASRSEKESDRVLEKVDGLKRKIKIRELQRTLWETNGDFSSRAQQSAEDVRNYIRELPAVLESLDAEIAEYSKDLRKAEQDLEDVKRHESLPVLTADLAVPKDGVYGFEVRYFDYSVHWDPVYEIHTDGEKPMELRMRARIRQDSGEDWNAAELSLFTGNPVASGTLPELTSVYLKIYVPEPAPSSRVRAKVMVGAANMDPMMYEMADAEESYAADETMELPKLMLTTPEAEVHTEETMTEYVLPGRWNVPKSGEGTMADLRTDILPAVYRIAAVPSASPYAYLIAEVAASELPFSQGIEAAVYYKEVYTGTVYVSSDLTKEKLEITLGQEERVHVSRKEVAQKTSTALFKGQKVTEHRFETRLSNLSDTQIRLTVKDQIPVSQDKDITVETLELSGFSLDKETGFLAKEIPLAAGETVTTTLSYKVAWPKDKRISETRRSSRRFCPTCGAAVTGQFCPECGSIVK